MAMVSCSSTESKKRSFVRSAPPTRRRRPLGSDGSQNSFIAGGDTNQTSAAHGHQNAARLSRASMDDGTVALQTTAQATGQVPVNGGFHSVTWPLLTAKSPMR